MKRILTVGIALVIMTMTTEAQPKFSQPHGLYDGGSLTVAIEREHADAEVRYTTDGSEPTAASQLYTEPLTIDGTTILRAAEVRDEALCSAITTATYIFTESVIMQSDKPEGYPKQWGSYTQIWGTAVADYEMDPEMTGNKYLKTDSKEFNIDGFKIIDRGDDSIVSDWAEGDLLKAIQELKKLKDEANNKEYWLIATTNNGFYDLDDPGNYLVLKSYEYNEKDDHYGINPKYNKYIK